MKKIALLIFSMSTIAFNSIAQGGLTGSVSKSSVQANVAKLTKKVLIKEFPTSAVPRIILNNSFGNYEIKVWEKNTVKVELSVYLDTTQYFSEEEAWEKSSIAVSAMRDQVSIVTKPRSAYTIGPMGKATTITSSLTPTNGDANSPNVSRNMIIYLPVKSLVEITGRFQDILVSAAIQNLDLNITNCQVQGREVGNLNVRADFSNVNFDKVSTATVVFNQGMFIAKSIDQLTINSKSSIYELQEVKTAIIESNNDNFEFETLSDLKLKKKLGKIRIEKLAKSLDVKGENVDIKVRNVLSSVDSITINNSLGFVSIPLSTLKNYKVDFVGTSSTIYAPFNIKYEETGPRIPASKGIRDTIEEKELMPAVKFKHQEGTMANKYVSLAIVCDKCTIDFK